jgi:hypothetical protein
LLFSRHGVMFFPDPVMGFTALRSAVRRGAPIVFSCFRAASLNDWATELISAVTGAPMRLPDGYEPGPFAFADRDFVTAMLAAAGWREARCEPVDFAYIAGEGADAVGDALDFFRVIGPTAPLLRAATPEQRDGVMARFAQIVERRHHDDVVAFPAAAWIWTAIAGDAA